MNDIIVYNGNNPFFFVSYAHKDSDKIYPYLKALQDAGYNIWFDKGIEAGTEWSNNIADHLSRCSAFLFFVSKNSVKSENCLDEVAYAKSHNKSSLLVFLDDDATLPVGTEMQTARFQRMFISRQESIAHFIENFSKASMFDICRTQDNQAPVQKTYEPVVQQNNNTTEKISKNKLLIIGIAAGVILIALIVAIVLIVSNNSGKNTNETPSNTDTVAGENGETTTAEKETEPEIIELSDSLSDFTFRLCGVVYKLPVNFETLRNDGWTLAYDSPETYIAGCCSEYSTVIKDGNSLDVVFYNNSEDAKQLKDCMIHEVSATKYDISDFCIAAEISFDSTPDDMTAKLGAPTSKDLDNTYGYNTYTWDFSEEKGAEIIINTENPDYNEINIENYEAAIETTEADDMAPGYLDTYTAPSELSSDMQSGIFSLDNTFYQLPAPVKEFIDNGWTIASGNTTVISGGRDYITLSKNGNLIDADIINYSINKELTENCMVTEITVPENTELSIILPGNITQNATENEVKNIAGITSYPSTYSTSYMLNSESGAEFSYSMTFSFNNETGKMKKISVSRQNYGTSVIP